MMNTEIDKRNPSDEAVYKSLRDDMTAHFTSFRQLQIQQYTICSVIWGTAITIGLKENLAWGVVGMCLALSLIIYATTKLGSHWHAAATRLGAYIFVAWELPELKRDSAESSFNRRHLWILTNRSESYYKKNSKRKGSFKSGLKHFYIQQCVLAIVSFIIFCFIFFINYIYGKNELFHIKWILLAGQCIVLILLLLVAIDNGLRTQESDDIDAREVINWEEYCAKRSQHDQKFLQAINSFRGAKLPAQERNS